MKISKAVFDEHRRPRFGNANPERMQLAFWEWMIRGEDSDKPEDQDALSRIGLIVRGGQLKSAMGPYRARDLFNVPPNIDDGPIWTFDRMGRTCSQLPDGRAICIGGEHEDFYDPDFCIYNDVIVFEPSGEIQIFGYPKHVFPPTDFHSATTTSDGIVIIGGLGYQDSRRPGDTPVYRLAYSDYRMTEVSTWGQKPGWIFKHTASFDSHQMLLVSGGELYDEFDGRKRYRGNFEDYALNPDTGEWKRLTNRNWRQLSIRQADGSLLVLDKRPKPVSLLPSGIDQSTATSEGWNRITFVSDGVSIELKVNIMQIEILVKGDLTKSVSDRLANEIREITEHATQSQWVLDE
jgi:hypothetical protein